MTMRPTLLVLLLAAAGFLQPAGAVDLPFTEDFELSDGGFTTATSNGWKWGAPLSPEGPGAARSGTRAWGTNLDGSYAANLDASLLSPVYDLSAEEGRHILLHWWQFLVTEEGFDYAETQVSKNGGGTWETVFGPRHGEIDGQWTERTVLLDPSYATDGFRVRFRLVTDHSTSVGGFFIDDLRLSAADFSPAVPLQDFEDGDGGYVAEGILSSWEHGTPISAPGAAFSGESAWATRLDGFYHADEDSTLTSPPMNLIAAEGQLLAVAWRQYLDTEEGFDFVHMEVSGDGGATWATALSASGQVSIGGWMRQHVFLPPGYATSAFRLRFRLTSDENFQYDGMALDDVAVLATGGLFPTAGSFTRSAPENYPVRFSRSHFAAAYHDPDGGEFDGIVVEELPGSGTLRLGANVVAAGAFLPAASLDELVYEPEADTTGTAAFAYSASNSYGPSPPATVTLLILGPTLQIVIADHPESRTVNPGDPVAFEVVAVSSLELSYQWRKDGEEIPGAKGPVLEIAAAEEEDEASYEVVAYHHEDAATSGSAFLSVNDPVTIVGQPGPSEVNEGSGIVFTVVATGTGRLDYQWYQDGDPLAGETESTLEILGAREGDGGAYHCVVTNVVGPESTEVFPLVVRLAPRIAASPMSIGIRKFRPASFQVVVEGDGPFTYQWLKDGQAIPGANEATITIEDPAEINMGAYSVRVSNGWASAESDPAELQVLLWGDVRGVYQDVLEREDAPPGETPCPGRLTIVLSGPGAASAVLTYEGRVHRFRGRLDAQLVLERVIRRRGLAPLAVRIQLDALEQAFRATISHEELGVRVESGARLPKHTYHATRNPAPQQGRYTVLLEPDAGAEAAPQAPGYLTGVVAKDGRARLTGQLPSGSTFSSAGWVQDAGGLPFHRIARRADRSLAGELCGRLWFDLEGAVPMVEGGLAWRHLPRPGAAFLPVPFVAMLQAEGSLYVRPSSSQPVLELPINAEMFALEIQGPVPGGNLERWVRLSPRNSFRIDPATEARIRFRLFRSSGRVSGAFTDVDTGRRLRMNGVVVQNRQSMGGYFRGLDETGRFVMTPRLQ